MARRLRQMQQEAEANYERSLAAHFDRQERAARDDLPELPPLPEFTVWEHLLSAAALFAIIAASFAVIVFVASAIRAVVRFLTR
jgi:hypothetical protein